MKMLPPAEYQARAHAVFEALAAELRALVPDAAIEHVGASAIPGAVSKGDLDICLIVAPRRHAAAVDALVQAGCAIKLDTLRTPELCMLLSPRRDIDAAVQIVAAGSRFETVFVRFRDALRADAALVERYNAIKREHAGGDAANYRAAKSAFVAEVLGGA